MKLYPWSSPELRAEPQDCSRSTRYDVPGAIVYADEDNGKCRVDVDGGMRIWTSGRMASVLSGGHDAIPEAIILRLIP
jgi:hypothetical protein